MSLAERKKKIRAHVIARAIMREVYKYVWTQLPQATKNKIQQYCQKADVTLADVLAALEEM